MAVLIEGFISGLERLLRKAETSSDEDFSSRVGLYIPSCLAFVRQHTTAISLHAYSCQGYDCVGLKIDDDTCLAGWPVFHGQLLCSSDAFQELASSMDGNASVSKPSDLCPFWNRSLTIYILHICPHAPVSAKVRPGYPDAPNEPSCFLTRLASKATKRPPKKVRKLSPWWYADHLCRLVYEIPPAPARSSSSSSASAAADDEPAAAQGPQPASEIDDADECPDFVAPTALKGRSFVDLRCHAQAQTHVYTDDAVPAVVWEDEPTATSLQSAYRPKISYFNVVLAALYAAPTSIYHESFPSLCLQASGGQLTSANFLALRRRNLSDKDGPRIWFSDATSRTPDVIVAPTRLPPSGTVAGKRCLMFRVACVRTVLEAHITRLISRDLLTLPAEGTPIVFLICGDGAGKLINDFKLWMFAALPLQATRTGSLEAVCPLGIAVGNFLVNPREHFLQQMGSQLSALTHVGVAGRVIPVDLRNISDLGDAASQYCTSDLTRPCDISFISATSTTHAMRFINGRPCPSCLASPSEICALPSVDLSPRLFPPMWRSNSLAVWHRYGRLHAQLHGVPVLLAEMIIYVHRRLGRTSVARWMASAFSRAGGFEPCPDVYAGEQPPIGSPSYMLSHAAPHQRWKYSSKRPAHSCRARDVKVFLDGGRSAIVTEANIREPPPRGFVASALDVLDLLTMLGPVDIPWGDSGRSVGLRTLFERTLTFFKGILRPTRELLGTPDARAAFRRLGDSCFEGLKWLAASNHAWDFRQSPPPAEVLQRLLPEQRDFIANRVRFHWSYTAVGPACHMAYQHSVDVFDEYDFDLASRATEEAFDHWFSYLFETVKLVNPRRIANSWAEDAELLWMTILEASQVCVPVGTRSEAIFNSSYVHRSERIPCGVDAE